MRKSTAFTLIELLVVIAIITLLISILVPSMHQGRELAIRVSCQSNLRNCGIAMQGYATANGGYFPAHKPRTDISYQANVYLLTGWHWDLREKFEPHIGSFDVWKCPALPQAVSIDAPSNIRFASYATYRYYPGRKWPQFARPGEEQYVNPQPQPDCLHLVKDPSRQVVIQDAFIDDWVMTGTARFNHGYGTVQVDWAPGAGTPSYVVKLGPFGYGASLLFHDGHAEWFDFDELEPVGAVLGYPTSATILAHSRLP